MTVTYISPACFSVRSIILKQTLFINPRSTKPIVLSRTVMPTLFRSVTNNFQFARNPRWGNAMSHLSSAWYQLVHEKCWFYIATLVVSGISVARRGKSFSRSWEWNEKRRRTSFSLVNKRLYNTQNEDWNRRCYRDKYSVRLALKALLLIGL